MSENIKDKSTIYAVGDEASKALFAAGQASQKIEARYTLVRVDESTVEPVVTTISPTSHVELNTDLTAELRRAAKTPVVIRERLALDRVDDLVAYLARYGKAGETVIFASAPKLDSRGSFVAVIDYGTWCRQRAGISAAVSDEARAWHEKTRSQFEFAKLLDEWAAQVVADKVKGGPMSGDLLDMADKLEVTETAMSSYKRNPKTRLWDAELSGKTTTNCTIYPAFGLLMPVLKDRPEREVEIRLELVKRGDSFAFSTRIHNLDRLVREEFATMAQELTEKTKFPVWQGEAPPEMPVK